MGLGKWPAICAVVMALCFFAGMGTASEDTPAKARTVDELAEMFDVSSCRECHIEIYQEWEKSLHARSLVGTPRTADACGRLWGAYVIDGQWNYTGINKIEDLKVEDVMLCFECHLPQIKHATDEVAQELAQAAIDKDFKKLGKVNINCLVCHNMKALIHEWTYGPPDKDAVYGSKDAEHTDAPVYTKIKKSSAMDESIFCGQCHGLGPMFHYPNPVHCATIYGSYMHNYLPSGGTQTCQDCHLKKGHLMPSYRDEDRAKSAVDVEVKTFSYYFHPKPFGWIPLAVVQVDLESNAGHRIPDG